MEPSKPAEPIEAPKYAEPPSALMEALRAQLRTILDKPLTPRSLLEMEQTARLSRELLIVGKMPEAKRTGYPGSIMSPMFLGDTASYESSAAPYVSSPQSETFGVSMIRELVAKLPELMKPKEVVYRESAASLIDAITAARDAKMDDVVQKLKAKLDALLEPEPQPTISTVASNFIEPKASTGFGAQPLMAGPGGYVQIEAQPIIGVGTVVSSSNGASS